MTDTTTTDTNTTTTTTEAVTRPDFFPAKYWDDKAPLSADALKNPAIQNLAKGYNEANTALSRGREGYKAEYEAERLKNRPADPAAYTIGVPKEGPLAERAAKSGIQILTEKPAEGFKPEPGKTYFVVNKADPLWNYWRGVAHANGLSNDQFMEGVLAFAESQGMKIPTAEQTAAERKTFYASLGEHGEARVQHLYGQLKGALGDQRAAALDDIVATKEGVEALEALMEKAGAPKFAPANAGSETVNKDAKARYDELRALQTSDAAKYWSKEVQDELMVLGKKLFPGVQNVSGNTQAA